MITGLVQQRTHRLFDIYNIILLKENNCSTNILCQYKHGQSLKTDLIISNYMIW